MHIPEGYQLFEWVDPFEELVGPLCFKEEPDGRVRFAFEAKPKDSPSGWQTSIYVMAATGGAARQVTPSKFNDFSPTWWIVRSIARAAIDAGSNHLNEPAIAVVEAPQE